MKLYCIVLYFVLASVLLAQTDSMIIELSDGSVRAYALSSIRQIDFSGGTTAIEEQGRSNNVAGTFRILQNYPNPFNPTTNIVYEIPYTGFVGITIFDIQGRAIRTYAGLRQEEGRHSVVWDGRNDSKVTVSSGIYFCRILFENNFLVNKLVFVK